MLTCNPPYPIILRVVTYPAAADVQDCCILRASLGQRLLIVTACGIKVLVIGPLNNTLPDSTASLNTALTSSMLVWPYRQCA